VGAPGESKRVLRHGGAGSQARCLTDGSFHNRVAVKGVQFFDNLALYNLVAGCREAIGLVKRPGLRAERQGLVVIRLVSGLLHVFAGPNTIWQCLGEPSSH
jgi:hypothetical protein